jgi:hypothetical protein
VLRADLHKYFLAQTGGLDASGAVTEEGKIFDVAFIRDVMAPAVTAAVNHEIEALALLLPVRHTKTWFVSKHTIPWAFGRFPQRSNMLLSYSDVFAKRFGRNILDRMQTMVHRSLFPANQISKYAHGGNYFEITNGAFFASAGFDGQISGLGIGGIFVIDDPIKNIEEARSQAHEQTLMDVYLSTVKTRLENASTIMATTRWCRGDFFERVIDEEGLAEDGGKWTVITLPAEARDNDPVGRVPGEYLWPERWSEKWYQNAKKNKRFWPALYQQDPQSASGKKFERSWLNFYREAIRPGKFKTYMICDPAKGGKDKSSNRTSIPVFAAAPGKKLMLVDWALGRFDPDERADHWLRLYRKWKPVRAVYEEYGLVNDSWYLNKRMKDLGFNARAIPVGRKGRAFRHSKGDRIDSLIPDFREGMLWLPDEQSPNRAAMLGKEDGEPFDPVQYLIEQEYVEWAGEDSIPNDDALDSFAWLHCDELGITYPRDDTPREPDYMNIYKKTSARPRSWELW